MQNTEQKMGKDEDFADNIITELKKKIKLCNIVSVASLILIAICMIAELIVGYAVSQEQLARKIINGIGYFCYLLPFAVLIPMFFKVNLKSKLIVKIKEKEGK